MNIKMENRDIQRTTAAVTRGKY